MAPRNRIIIDTDPGVDDILAMLLALSASPEELEVVMLSVTYGNVPLYSCLRNVVALFHVIDKEMAWRRETFRPEGFENLRTFKPIVAVGAEHPLTEETLMADYFHGLDGLHGVHEKHPHLTPVETWKKLFKQDDCDSAASSEELQSMAKYFTPSSFPAHKKMLEILRENPSDTISIACVGPMTNVALAAAEDPETFLRVKQLVVMGGAVHVTGNITPVAEFNTYADTVAAARVFALTSLKPGSTMPVLPKDFSSLPPYPSKLSRRLKLTLFPLDITTAHILERAQFTKKIQPAKEAGSPLAQWVDHFLSRTFDHIEAIVGEHEDPGLSLHDPMTVWYLMTQSDPRWKTTPKPEDIRIETTGQWTKGMHVVDRRGRKKPGEAAVLQALIDGQDIHDLLVNEVPGDTMGWLSAHKGNRIDRMVSSPGESVLGEFLLDRVFAS